MVWQRSIWKVKMNQMCSLDVVARYTGEKGVEFREGWLLNDQVVADVCWRSGSRSWIEVWQRDSTYLDATIHYSIPEETARKIFKVLVGYVPMDMILHDVLLENDIPFPEGINLMGAWDVKLPQEAAPYNVLRPRLEVMESENGIRNKDHKRRR